MKKGDIVLVPFPFTDLKGYKKRPALILVNNLDSLNVVLAFISTKIEIKSQFDLTLLASSQNGLKKTSIVKLDKLTSLDRDLVEALIGEITQEDTHQLNLKLIELFQTNLN
ncbi:MAG: type II toxin-antitoxin system PemK/MazF family toxin [Candidatus Caenarcaniphilales bacterium]|nr:type II toxin-antitoxin system PemK/MazF family toxin [Candidatus Caenarcaniphilales bacterium]